MALQLVYTSVPKGLKPGSCGFCTVAHTRGLQDRAILTLEKLSGYRRVYPMGTAGTNPVVYSYLLVEEGGVATRVLSRIGESGLDYTNRDNKIACHYVLDAPDYGAAGPAALFSASALFPERWNSAPTLFETPTSFPNMPSEPLACAAWSRATGDPGWAGALASTAFTGQNALLIVDPACDVLRLFQEAISILPVQYRWNATFSTYFTKTLPSVRCQWKGVVKGSPEESAFRGLPNMLVLDLTNPASLPRVESIPNYAFASELVSFARVSGSASKPRASVRAQGAAPSTNASSARQEKSSNAQTNRTPVYSLRPESEALDEIVLDESQTYASIDKGVKEGIADRAREWRSLEEDKALAKRMTILRCALWGTLGFVVSTILAYVVLTSLGMDPLSGVKGLLERRDEVVKESQPDSKTHEKHTSESSEDLFDFGDDSEDVVRSASDDKKKKKKVDPAADRINRPFDGIPDGGLGENGTQEKRPTEPKKNAKDKNDDDEAEPSEVLDDNANANEVGKEDVRNAAPLKVVTPLEAMRINDFIDRVDAGETRVDFDFFGAAQNSSLRVDLIGDAQRSLKQVVTICKKYGGSIELACDLSADVDKAWSFTNDHSRKAEDKIDFKDRATQSSDVKTFRFSVVSNVSSGKAKKSKGGSFELELNVSDENGGLCAFIASDETTRNYFLAAAKFQWIVTIPDADEKEADVFKSEYVQLLKPYKFENNKNVPLASFNELSAVLGEQRPQLACPSSLETIKKTYALMVEPETDALDLDEKKKDKTIHDVKVDSSKVDFVYSIKTPDRNVREFMTIRLEKSANGNVLRNEVVYDEDELKNDLVDYYTREEEKGYKNKSNSDFKSVEEKVDRQVELFMKTVEAELAIDRTFKIYLASRKRDSQGNSIRTLWGETNLNAARDSSAARKSKK